MKVLNMHERELPVPAQQVGRLIDSLSSMQDSLWPRHSWPRMEFDRPLQVGATGGHGPIRYFVESYAQGSSVRFRFTGPKGFNGHHRFEIFEISTQACVLRHTLEMDAIGPAVVSWPLVFCPLHNALIEDSLALAQASLGQRPVVREWSSWVKLLRWLVSKGQARVQTTPNTAVNRDVPQAARPLP